MSQFWHETVYSSVRILSLLMLSAMPGMLGRNAAALIDLNSCNDVLFENTVNILVEVEVVPCAGNLINTLNRFNTIM